MFPLHFSQAVRNLEEVRAGDPHDVNLFSSRDAELRRTRGFHSLTDLLLYESF